MQKALTRSLTTDRPAACISGLLLRLVPVCVFFLALVPRSDAQFTADNQTNVVDSLLNYAGAYYIGNTNYGNVLIIETNGTITKAKECRKNIFCWKQMEQSKCEILG